MGTHQKKRPDNLVIGRTFDGHILDIFEFGIEDFKAISSFKAPQHVQSMHKPILIFQGEPFETSEKHKRLKNLLIDIFHQRDIKMANIVDVKKVILFTCKGDDKPIEFRQLECDEVTEKNVAMKTVPFREIGPSFKMRARRDKMAGFDLFKEACKKPKVRNMVKKRQDKNKYTTALGEEKGKVYLQQQDYDTLALRKYKGMGKKAEKAEAREKENKPKEMGA